MIKVIEGYDERVIKALQLLGVPTEHLREAHIHIEPDNAVWANCLYFIIVPDEAGVNQLKEVTKKFKLVEIDENEDYDLGIALMEKYGITEEDLDEYINSFKTKEEDGKIKT